MSDVNTYNPMAAVAEFHAAFEVKPFIEEDAYGRKQTTALRHSLIGEEWKEVSDELLDLSAGRGNRARLAKELADLLYVIYGTAAVYEIPIYDVFKEVHASNMSKLGTDGKPVRRADGKVLKGPGYRPADIDPILLPND